MSLISFIGDQFASSFRALQKTRTLTTTGLLLAVQIVLGSYGTIEVTDSLKISLSHLALAPTAIFFGPVVASMQGALSDIVGYLIKPTGPYFPGFTLSAMAAGAVYGLAFYRRSITVTRVACAHVFIKLFVNLGLNTLWLSILYKKAVWALLTARVAGNLLRLPGDVIVTYVMLKTVERAVLPLFKRRSAR